MHRLLPILSAALVLALSPGALGSFTGELDTVVVDIEARQAEFRAQGDRAGRRAARAIGRAARILKRRSVNRSLVGEIAGATRAAGIVEGRFPDEAGILDGFRSASGIYEQRVAVGTIVLRAQTEQPGLRRAKLRALQRKLARAQSGLDDATAAETVKQRLAALLRTARATKRATLTGESYTWVVATLSVTPRAQALGDHALADAADALDGHGMDLDVLLGNSVFTSPIVFLIELWAVDAFDSDPLVFAAALEGGDTDGNSSDNFSGSETFIGPLEADGHALLRTTTGLDGGAYDIELLPTSLSLGSIQIQDGERVRIVATASESTHSGRIATTVSVDDLIQAISLGGEEVTPEIIQELEALKDVDTDGDEQADALSATLSFSCARANVTSQ